MTSEELERAKRAAIASVYMNLESRAVVAEDIGRQILTYGHRCSIHKHHDCVDRPALIIACVCMWKIAHAAPVVAACLMSQDISSSLEM